MFLFSGTPFFFLDLESQRNIALFLCSMSAFVCTPFSIVTATQSSALREQQSDDAAFCMDSKKKKKMHFKLIPKLFCCCFFSKSSFTRMLFFFFPKMIPTTLIFRNTVETFRWTFRHFPSGFIFAHFVSMFGIWLFDPITIDRYANNRCSTDKGLTKKVHRSFSFVILFLQHEW